MDRVVRRFLIVGFGIVGKAVHAGLLQNETYDVAEKIFNSRIWYSR